jgi:hypothetical protein
VLCIRGTLGKGTLRMYPYLNAYQILNSDADENTHGPSYEQKREISILYNNCQSSRNYLMAYTWTPGNLVRSFTVI